MQSFVVRQKAAASLEGDHKRLLYLVLRMLMKL